MALWGSAVRPRYAPPKSLTYFLKKQRRGSMSISTIELEKALRRLEEALALEKNDITRDSSIQRFEFTIELSWKVMKRILNSEGIQETDSPKSIIRSAAKASLVDDAELWLHLIDQRNLSSHTYREDLAEQVYAAAKKTPPLVHRFLKNAHVRIK